MRRNHIWSFARLKCDNTCAETRFGLSTRNGPVHLNLPVGGVSSVDCWPAEVCGISSSNAGYTVFRGSVKSTGYPLHSPVPPFISPLVRHRVDSNREIKIYLVACGFEILNHLCKQKSK